MNYKTHIVKSCYGCSGNQLSNPFYRNLQSSSSQNSSFSQSMEIILLIKKIIFIFKIPFLSQQVAKFLCLLPGEHQETASSPTEPPRTMTSSLHLPMVHKHQLDHPNHDPAGLHQKFITENPMGLRQHWKMLMQKLQNSWERVMPLKK